MKDKKPSCFIDIMLESDVYKGDVTTITNDMIIAMIAGTETSRNTTIMSLCHLIKTGRSRETVKSEINQSMQKYKIDDVMQMGHKNTGPSDFEFLNCIICESMRFNPPAVATEGYKI